MGFYACESSHVDESSLAHYTASLVHYLAPNTIRASSAMVFTSSDSVDDDPSTIIFTRRVAMFRRFIIKNPA